MVCEVYRNFNGRYVIKSLKPVGFGPWYEVDGMWGSEPKEFLFKWSAILKAKQLEREHDKSLRRLKFKPVKVWR